MVLGDKRQFSNVKTTNASREINAKYTHEIIDNFRQSSALDANTLNRLQKFNIKVSVLEFIERIANYNALLKKHFRGYPELCSDHTISWPKKLRFLTCSPRVRTLSGEKSNLIGRKT